MTTSLFIKELTGLRLRHLRIKRIFPTAASLPKEDHD